MTKWKLPLSSSPYRLCTTSLGIISALHISKTLVADNAVPYRLHHVVTGRLLSQLPLLPPCHHHLPPDALYVHCPMGTAATAAKGTGCFFKLFELFSLVSSRKWTRAIIDTILWFK